MQNHSQKGSATVIAFIILLLILGGTVWYFKNFATEDGGYSGTAFCNIMNSSRYKLKGRLITIDDAGPYTIAINEMRNRFSPYEYPKTELIKHLRFDDKNNTYADTLYVGKDDQLYNCHGGK